MAGDVSRIESIFVAALDLHDLEERAAFLDEACGGDDVLRGRVQRLLHAHPQLGDFLQRNAAQLEATQCPAIAERPGTTIGRYKLLQQIGEGGFGVVFMAEQIEPVRRKVALKIIKPGMDTKEVVARFEAERQALALMDHPNIARVFDAGATETGRPYFVMELVRGIAITEYCDQNSLPPRARLELFTSVCQAVQHAHHKGIIHRDVKPSNVLITLHDGTPVVKVIDFGVAKAIDRRLTERTLFTRFAEMIGTPLYMSPEQAELSGLDVDTRTDVYSLGVLLYELLTGETPFDRERLGKAAYDEIRRIIREEEPPRPSLRISTMGGRATAVSEHRRTEPKKLSALLKGDLDWIVMKALEKDRTRRYATPKEFADDIQYYLTDQPVEARAPSALYRVRKFARRYRAVTATIAAIAATLVAATAFSAWMAVRETRAKTEAEGERQVAREEADKSRKAAADAELMLRIIGRAIGAEVDTPAADEDRTTSETLQRLALRLDTRRDVNFRVAATMRVFIGKAYARAAQLPAAETQFRRAIEAVPDIKNDAADRALEPQARQITDAWTEVADATRDAGLHELAAVANRKAAETWERMSKLNPGNTWYRSQAASYLLNLGNILQISDPESQAEAEAAYRRAIQLQRTVLAELPNDPDYRQRMLQIHESLMQLLISSGRDEEALSLLSDTVASDEFTKDPDWQQRAWMQLGYAFRSASKFPQAQDAFSRALQLCDQVGNEATQRRHEAALHLSDASFYARDWHSAESAHRQFLLSVQDHNDLRVADHRGWLVCALVAQGQSDEAEMILREASTATTPEAQWQFWTGLAYGYTRLGRLFDAKDAFERAWALSETLSEQKISRRMQTADSLSGLMLSLRDGPAAEHYARQAVDLTYSLDKKDPVERLFRNFNLCMAFHLQQKADDALRVTLDCRSIVDTLRRERREPFPESCLNSLLHARLLAYTRSDAAALQDALRILDSAKPGHRKVSRLLLCRVRAEIYEKMNRHEEAIQNMRSALDDLESLFPDWFFDRDECRMLLARVYRTAGQLHEAEAMMRRSLAVNSERFGDDHFSTQYSRMDLGELLLERGNVAEAEELLRQAREGLASDERVPAIQSQRAARLLVHACEVAGKTDEAARWPGAIRPLPAAQPEETDAPSALIPSAAAR